MRRILNILLLATVLLAASCERRPLMELSNTHYVRVYVDETIKNVTTGFYNEDYVKPLYKSPDIMRIMLADPQTGQIRAERFLRNKGKDDKGLYYDGYIIADPGEYTLLAYNFDTEATIISNQNNHKNAYAYTDGIASHLKTKIPSRAKKSPSGTPEQIVYDPDHLFAANCGRVHVPYADYVDTLSTPEGEYFHAESIVKSYFLQVRVKGMQYATSSIGLLTGMSGSARLHTGQMDQDNNVTVYFEMLPGESPATGMTRAGTDEAIIYTTFGTFGKLPDAENELEITFDFLTVYGKAHSETFNITDLFSTPEAIDHQWLLIDHVIEIPEPPKIEGGSGGFKPSVDEWEDVKTDILI